MKTIGVRELRQYASRYLREVERGEAFQVTDRGRPVAVLRPLTFKSPLDELEAQGRLMWRAKGDLLKVKPARRKKGRPPLSEILQQMRDEERS
jgi:prevent-host-death family protein